MPAGGNGSAIVVERADRALVVRSMDAGTGAVGFAAALPPEPSRTTVVVDASAAGALHALDDRLLDQLMGRLYADAPPGSEMRLVAARAGRPDPSGAPPLAARLADRLGMGVVAPDGELIALRGGELFSAGPGAGWLGFRRGGHPEWTGPRYPAPVWQAALPREFRTAKPRPFARLRGRDRRAPAGPVTVTAIPAGLWVRGAGSTALPLVDLGFGVPVEPARPVVLVGAPGERTPEVTELAAFFASLPPVVRENAVLVPYGQEPEACAALAQSLADRLDITVRAYHALPHYATDGSRRFAIFNARGAPDRLTRTPEDVYSPAAWHTPYPEATVHEPGLMDLSTVTPGPAESPAEGTAEVEVKAEAGELDDDLGDEDPVVFEASIDTPTQPVPTLDDSALTTPPTAPHGTTAVVTVDARGFMRPAGRWSIATSPNPRPGLPSAFASGDPPENGRALAPDKPLDVPSTWPPTAPGRTPTSTPDAPVEATAADAPSFSPFTAPGSPSTAPGRVPASVRNEPVEAVAGDASSLPPAAAPGVPVPFQTTASTVLPQTYPVTRDVPSESRTAAAGPPVAPPLPIPLADDPVLSGSAPVPGGAATPEPDPSPHEAPVRAEAPRQEPYRSPLDVPEQAEPDPLPADPRTSMGESPMSVVPRTPSPAGVGWTSGDEARDLSTPPEAALPPGDVRVSTGDGGVPAVPPPTGGAWTSGGEVRNPGAPPEAVRRTQPTVGDAWTVESEARGLGARSAPEAVPPQGVVPGLAVDAATPPFPASGPAGSSVTGPFLAPAGPPPPAEPSAAAGVSLSAGPAIASEPVIAAGAPFPAGPGVAAEPPIGAGVSAEAPGSDYDRRWLADRGSTPEERQAFRASLGWRYDAAARSVARLLAEHPGLRGAATDEALMTELAAVRVFVARDQAELVSSIRSGGGNDPVLAVCAAAGLRRLPSFQGVVVRGGPAGASAADAYRPGQDLVEAAPLFALDDVDAGVPGAVEVIIWSATARRLSGFAEDRPVPEVAFLPGTVFRVLDVGPPPAPGEVRRVLLTEVPPAKSGPGLDEWAGRILARLEEAAANRTAEPAEPDDRFAPLPGDPARSMP